jgi:hypothetical protein
MMGRKPATKSAKISLADIARSLNMSPKTARRKMRAYWHGQRQGGWTFDASKRKEIVAVLEGKMSFTVLELIAVEAALEFVHKVGSFDEWPKFQWDALRRAEAKIKRFTGVA